MGRVKIWGLFAEPGFRLLNRAHPLGIALPVFVFVSIARYSMSEILGFGKRGSFAFVGLGVCFVLAVALSHLMRLDREYLIEDPRAQNHNAALTADRCMRAPPQTK